MNAAPHSLTRWFGVRFERGTRYYEVHLEQDLWGAWTVSRVHGRKGSALGRIRTTWFGARQDAATPLLTLIERRHRRHYQLLHSNSFDPEDDAMEPVQEVLNLLKRQAEIESRMRSRDGIRIIEERELVAIREKLKRFPAATQAALEAAQELRRPVDALSVRDIERYAGVDTENSHAA